MHHETELTLHKSYICPQWLYVCSSREICVSLFFVFFEANPCEACVVLLIGAAAPDQLITVLCPTWIQHMTAPG